MPGLGTIPRLVCTTPYQVAQRFLGLKEVPGSGDNPLIVKMLRLEDTWPEHDEVPWCSAFVNFICHVLNVPRSHSLKARSWLATGRPVNLEHAEAGFDVAVLKRGGGAQPGPHDLEAAGHVGFFSHHDTEHQRVQLLDGNSNNQVTYTSYPVARLLGIRRLYL